MSNRISFNNTLDPTVVIPVWCTPVAFVSSSRALELFFILLPWDCVCGSGGNCGGDYIVCEPLSAGCCQFQS